MESEVFGSSESFAVISSRLRDFEERQRLLKDRILLIGDSFVRERDQARVELSDLKRSLIIIQQEHDRLKELVLRLTEQIAGLARKEEFLILQKQFEILRDHKHGN